MAQTKWTSETLGGRLRSAIDAMPSERKRRGVGLLISRLGERGAPGASYPSINSYLRDKVAPPLEFLDAAADALGVRFAWLAQGGDEPRTEEDFKAQWMRRGDQREGAEASYRERVRAAVPDLAQLDVIVEAVFTGVIVRMGLAQQRAGIPLSADNLEEVATGIWGFIREPINLWENLLGRRIPMNPMEFNDYAIVMLHALLLSTHVAIPQGISLEEIEEWEPIDPDEEESNDD